MANNKHYFNTIRFVCLSQQPDAILSIIYENLSIEELLQQLIVCKRFNSMKYYFRTLLLSEKCINHIPHILNHIRNDCITQIFIKHFPKMDDNHLQQLAHLQHIDTFVAGNNFKELGFYYRSKIGPKNICKYFKNLKRLSLDKILIHREHDYVRPDLSGFESLEFLKLNNCSLNGYSFKYMINLRELCMKVHMEYDWCENIAKIQNIQKIDISDCYVSSTQLMCITNVQKLQELTLDVDSYLLDQNMKYLTNLKQLRKLNILNGVKLTDDGLLHITNIVGLQELTLASCNKISDDALKHAMSCIPKIILI